MDVRDPDDAVVLSIALSGGGDMLVTGDRDLLALANDLMIQPLHIVTLAQFFERVLNRTPG